MKFQRIFAVPCIGNISCHCGSHDHRLTRSSGALAENAKKGFNVSNLPQDVERQRSKRVLGHSGTTGGRVSDAGSSAGQTAKAADEDSELAEFDDDGADDEL